MSSGPSSRTTCTTRPPLEAAATPVSWPAARPPPWRRSPLPGWYPRTPLRDITVIVKPQANGRNGTRYKENRKTTLVIGNNRPCKAGGKASRNQEIEQQFMSNKFRNIPAFSISSSPTSIISSSIISSSAGGVLLRSGRTILYRRDDEAVVSGDLVLQEKEHAQEKKEHAQEKKKEQDKALRTWDRCCWTWDLGSLLLNLGPGIDAVVCSFWETRTLLGAPGSMRPWIAAAGDEDLSALRSRDLGLGAPGTWACGGEAGAGGGEAGVGGRTMAWRRISNPGAWRRSRGGRTMDDGLADGGRRWPGDTDSN